MTRHRHSARTRITTVLELVPDPSKRRIDNPYTALLVKSLLRNDLAVRYFTWKVALTGRYDVVHAHWPEQLVRHRHAMAAALKTLLALIWLLRLRAQRIPIVRTLHNEKPHESGSRLEHILLRAFDRRTTDFIVLNPTTTAPHGEVHLILHGHYREWFPLATQAHRNGKLLAFGLVRPYKGTDDLISAFRGLPAKDLSLQIAGKCSTAELEAELTALAIDDERVVLDLRFIPENELTTLIGSSEMVLLPYRDMQNSGAALLALSLNRPVIVLDSPSSKLLEEEFGSAWVTRIDSSHLDTSLLSDAIERVRSAKRSEGGPDMSTRDWTMLGRQTADVLSAAAQARFER